MSGDKMKTEGTLDFCLSEMKLDIDLKISKVIEKHDSIKLSDDLEEIKSMFYEIINALERELENVKEDNP